MLEIGSLVDGKYKVLNKIGQGGMSVVYLAMNERANKQWAIKEVRKDGVQNFEIVKQGLIAETRILKQLHHPYLPSIVDIVDKDDSFLIVMDYIEGNPLSKKLDEEGAQPQEQVIEWAKEMCDVLGYLHTRKPPIIYRDMKPGNLMLKPDGTITLIDFGTAREFKEKAVKDTTCLGTVGYAAPEQFGGSQQSDARTDIYCLGATIYHLVTGCDPTEPPYDIQPIRSVNPNLSGGLEQIILKCTQRDPKDRYQSCAELMYALEHYDEIDTQYLRTQKRRLILFAVLACLTFLSLATGVGTRIALQNANDARYARYLELASDTSTSIGGRIGTSDTAKIREDRIDNLNTAIDLLPANTDAYQDMIYLFETENEDGTIVFTPEDEATLMAKWIPNREAIRQANREDYAALNFEIGKLYWYYYNYSPQNQPERMQNAVPYFEAVTEDAPDSYPYKQMAQTYQNIGLFQQTISRDYNEGVDRGMYADLYAQLLDMNNSLAGTDEPEIEKLELYRTTINFFDTYSLQFRSDGVTQTQLTTLADTVFSETEAISPLPGTSQELKDYILSKKEDLKKTIADAYADTGTAASALEE